MPVVAQGHKVWLQNRLVVGAIPLQEIKYLSTFIFSFRRSGVEAESGVEFRHSIHNASRTRRKVGNGMF